MSAGGGDQKSEHARSGSATLPNPISTVDTRKELADTVGLGERTMGKVMQIDEHAPADGQRGAGQRRSCPSTRATRSPSRWRTCRRSSREQAALEAVELAKGEKGDPGKDAEIDREGKIAGVFCKAYEKAVLLDPTEENVRIWAKCTRMTRDEMEDTVKRVP